ncbi:hypothetical protein AX14_003278 [Amanita brunnescens Koide BX004]|nr:hypothetical protein AX14_003278 [Amanita brunnescens Koide BX004]
MVHAAYFLCRLLMRKVSEHGEHVYLESIRRKVEFCVHASSTPSQANNILIFSPSLPLPFTQNILMFSPSLFTRFHLNPRHPKPATLPARAFKSKKIMNLPRDSLQETELIQYQHRPELLQTETFVYFNEDEADYEAFRIPAFLTADQETIFYVVFADTGPTGMAFASVDLFDLRTSERVIIDSE